MDNSNIAPAPRVHARSSRRDFLRTAALATAAAAVTVRAPAASAGSGYMTSSDPSSDIIWMSATRLAQLIREKKISAVDAVKSFIARIETVNPRINAVVQTCFDRALAEAKAADEALAKGTLLGPLHGVPMTIKDSLETAGVVSTGGTLGRINFVPAKDATAVARARAAGAILLGKSNTPEFTLAGYSGLTTTWNLIYGITRNPYNNMHSSAGSSGGAGAIVAAGGSAFDIGSDFGGSIRGPAHANGICGIKPSTGRVPRTGHIVDYGGIFDSYQQVGPLARRIEDLMLVTPIIAGPDGKDAAIVPAPFLQADEVELKKLRVAFYTTNGLTHPTAEMRAAVKKAADAMAGLGASTKEDIHPFYKEAVELRTTLRTIDGNAWMKRLADRYGSRTVSPSLQFTEPKGTSVDLVAGLQTQDIYRRAMTSWLKDYDVIICPANSGPAPRIDDRRDGAVSYTQIYNITGWPAVIVRGGTSAEGLPLGVQVVARPFREDVAFAVARHLEGVLGGWQRPPI